MIEIVFLAQGANSVIGSFQHGDVARVGPDMARHLVEEAKVARYAAHPEQTVIDTAAAVQRKRRKAG